MTDLNPKLKLIEQTSAFVKLPHEILDSILSHVMLAEVGLPQTASRLSASCQQMRAYIESSDSLRIVKELYDTPALAKSEIHANNQRPEVKANLELYKKYPEGSMIKSVNYMYQKSYYDLTDDDLKISKIIASRMLNEKHYTQSRFWRNGPGVLKCARSYLPSKTDDYVKRNLNSIPDNKLVLMCLGQQGHAFEKIAIPVLKDKMKNNAIPLSAFRGIGHNDIFVAYFLNPAKRKFGDLAEIYYKEQLPSMGDSTLIESVIHNNQKKGITSANEVIKQKLNNKTLNPKVFWFTLKDSVSGLQSLFPAEVKAFAQATAAQFVKQDFVRACEVSVHLDYIHNESLHPFGDLLRPHIISLLNSDTLSPNFNDPDTFSLAEQLIPSFGEPALRFFERHYPVHEKTTVELMNLVIENSSPAIRVIRQALFDRLKDKHFVLNNENHDQIMSQALAYMTKVDPECANVLARFIQSHCERLSNEMLLFIHEGNHHFPDLKQKVIEVLKQRLMNNTFWLNKGDIDHTFRKAVDLMPVCRDEAMTFADRNFLSVSVWLMIEMVQNPQHPLHTEAKLVSANFLENNDQQHVQHPTAMNVALDLALNSANIIQSSATYAQANLHRLTDAQILGIVQQPTHPAHALAVNYMNKKLYTSDVMPFLNVTHWQNVEAVLSLSHYLDPNSVRHFMNKNTAVLSYENLKNSTLIPGLAKNKILQLMTTDVENAQWSGGEPMDISR